MAIARNKGKRLNCYVKDYTVFDLETTGIRQGLDEIIEVSALRVRSGSIEEEFSTLVRPGIRIPPAATAVNGITNDMVKDAPDIATVLDDFISFIGNDILVGHNIHSFDLNFICDAAQEFSQKAVLNDYVDTLYLARKCLPQLSHHKLTDVSSYFGVDTEGAHRALNDCVMNQRCYEELGKLLALRKAEEPERICPRCGGEMVRRKGKFGEFYGCSGYPVCRQTMKV